jgi:hypothetical protein
MDNALVMTASAITTRLTRLARRAFDFFMAPYRRLTQEQHDDLTTY